MEGPWFFIGVGGSGMSALAQILSFRGEVVAGSDRDFARDPNSAIYRGLTKVGVRCFPQDGSGLTAEIKSVVFSTAIEADHPELQKAKELGCRVIHRSELLAHLCSQMRTIAVAGTSGKSTTAAMLFHILKKAGLDPSLISGAGLVELEEEGWIGNAWGGKERPGEKGWLVIEADESDGSIVHYHPEIGLLLNIDRDHKEVDELMKLFSTFAEQSKKLIVNRDHDAARSLSRNRALDFSLNDKTAGTALEESLPRRGGGWNFTIDGVKGEINQPGLHNLANAVAAIAAARAAAVPLQNAVDALADFRGIWRRYQRIAIVNGVAVVDDFAHNPAKIAAAVTTAQSESKRLLAWFQPHGFTPARFMRHELAEKLSQLLRPNDIFWFSEIHYAGGTVTRDISGADLAEDLRQLGTDSRFAATRKEAVEQLVATAEPGDTILLMGARDPSLEGFAQEVVTALQKR